MNTLPPILRRILWPIADFRWQRKIDPRLLLTCYKPLTFLTTPYDEEPFPLGGDVFEPVQLSPNGSVRVRDKIYPRNTSFGDKLGAKESIYREGPLLMILSDDRPRYVLTYEEGAWLQWTPEPPALRHAIRTEYRLIRELGARTATKTVLWSLMAVFALFALVFLLGILRSYR